MATARRISISEWESLKATISTLYLNENKTLAELMQCMETEHNFSASEAQYVRKLKLWGMKKNSTNDQWKFVAERMRKRQLEGKESEVLVNGKAVSAKRLKKETSRYGRKNAMDVEDPAASDNPPDGIVVRTPMMESPESVDYSSIPWFQFQDLVEPSLEFIAQGSSQTLNNIEPIDFSNEMLTAIEMDSIFNSFNLDLSLHGPSPVVCGIHDGAAGVSLREPIPAFLDSECSVTGELMIPSTSTLGSDSIEEDNRITRDLLRACLRSSISPDSPDYVSQISSTLENITLERHDGDLVRHVKALYGTSTVESSFQLLRYVVFLSSNNQLSEAKTDRIMRWLIYNKNFWMAEHMIKSHLPTTDIFASHLLLSATRLEKIDAVRTLLANGVDPNTLAGISNKQTALQLATKFSNASLVSLLLDSGADPNAHQKITTMMMPLELAVRGPASGLAIAQMLIAKGAKVNLAFRSFNKDTLLKMAISDQNVELTKLLLKAGANVNEARGKRGSALQTAAMRNNLELVEILISAGADVDSPNGKIYRTSCVKAAKKRLYDFFKTPIQYAADHNNVEMVQVLLEAGADVNAFPARRYIRRLKDDDMDNATDYNEMEIDDSDSDEDCDSGGYGSEKSDDSESDNGSGDGLDDTESEDDAKYADSYDEFIGCRPIQTALQEAVKRKNAVLVRLLLSLGADININGSHGTALQTASSVWPNQPNMVRLLLNKGANVNSPAWGPGGRTALQAAAEFGNLDLVELLLKAGADVNAPVCHSGGRTAIQAAVSSKDLELINRLLRAGADVNAPASAPGGLSALQRAVRLNSIELVKLLIRAGANVNAPPCGSQGNTAIQEAASIGNIELVKLLIDAGANVNAPPAPSRGQTCLQTAVSLRNLDMVDFLLQMGADIHGPAATEEYGRTAFQLAVELNQTALIERFLEAGADVNEHRSQRSGGSVLGFAIENADYELARFFIQKRADPNVGSRSAPLGIVARRGETEMVQCLLKAGAKVDGDDIFESPLEMAVSNEKIDTARILISAGADINCYTAAKHGDTALQRAVDGGYNDLVDLLLSKGASPDRIVCNGSWAAILMAVKNWKCHAHILQALVNHGATLNAHHGAPIQTAARMGYSDAVQILIKAGVDVNAPARGKNGKTALQAAVTTRNIGLVEMLLDADAEVNAPPSPELGETALQAAAGRGYLNIVQLLLSRGADVNSPAAETNGATALQKAAIGGHLRIALLLLKKGADINAAPAAYGGRTALDGAAEHGRLDMLYLLLRNDKELETIETRCKKAAKMATDNGHDILARILRDWKAEPMNT